MKCNHEAYVCNKSPSKPAYDLGVKWEAQREEAARLRGSPSHRGFVGGLDHSLIWLERFFPLLTNRFYENSRRGWRRNNKPGLRRFLSRTFRSQVTWRRAASPELPMQGVGEQAHRRGPTSDPR